MTEHAIVSRIPADGRVALGENWQVGGSGLPESDVARVRRGCVQRVPAHLRNEIRVECNIGPGHLTIVECRPPWRKDMGE